MLWDTIKLVLRKINVKDENLGYVKTLLYYWCKKKFVQLSKEVFTNIYKILGLFIFIHPVIPGTGIYPKEIRNMAKIYLQVWLSPLCSQNSKKLEICPHVQQLQNI